MTETFPLKPIYRLHDLAIFFQMSDKATDSILRKLNVPIFKLKGRRYVYLTSIMDNQPDLYRSLLETVKYQSYDPISPPQDTIC
jgi:hypothetical protein